MTTWQHVPTKREVEQEVTLFFALLRDADLEGAKAALAHEFDDWESQIWSLWQDTYLVLLEETGDEVEDDSLEGKEWQADRGWLQDLSIEDQFHWDEEGDSVRVEGEHLFVNVLYKGERTDVSADFQVARIDGRYELVREAIGIK